MSKIIAVIQTCTGNLTVSKDFYQKLNFDCLSEKEPTLFTDGKMLLEINPDNFVRTGLKLYQADWKETIALLRQSGENN